MKKFTLTLFLALFMLLGSIAVSAQSKTLSGGIKVFPRHNVTIRDSIFLVRMDTKNPQQIKYIDLYINNRSVGRDYRAPFRWGKGSGLRGGPKVLKPGTYKLKAVIRTKDGKQATKYSVYRVSGRR